MNQNDMNKTVLEVYKKNKVKSFPIDCFSILDSYKIPYIPYSSLNDKKRIACIELSKDAFISNGTIFYNDYMPKDRIRFTLMHEFSHYILGHEEESKENEHDADLLASMILAPMIIIHNLKDKTADNIREYFDVSITAANTYVLDYHRWFYNIAHTTRKPTDSEIAIKELFVEKPRPIKRRTPSKNTHKLRYILDTSNDDYIIHEMERRRTEPY